MKLSIKLDNPNYVARVFSLPKPAAHPNANKLVLVTTLGSVVITGIDAKEGTPYIYFPVECAINRDYLSWSNSFNDTELNRDKTKKGFFSDKCRVKAIRLRGTPSDGYIVPVQNVVDWINESRSPSDLGDDTVTADDFPIGAEFDHIGDCKFVEKYVNINALRAQQNREKAEKNKHGRVKRVSKLVDDQFRFHIHTKHLKRDIGNITPDDLITISYKMHGASAIISKILCKKKLKWYEKLAKKLGVNVLDNHYDYIWSSRRVIKNQYEEEKKQNIHYYDTDIWSLAAARINPVLKNGISIYCELVGQTPTGSWIQKPYDYGTSEKQMEVYVYRITYTNPTGDVLEFTSQQVKRYCDKFGLKMVPIFYYGKAKDVFPELSTTEHWHDNFLEKLKQKYTEKDCFMCKGNIPEEGICVIVEKDHFEAYKLKSFKFLEYETSELDSGTVDLETQESTIIES